MYSRQPPSERRVPTPEGPATLRAHHLGPHPLLHHYLQRMDLHGILNGCLGASLQEGLSHAQALEVLVHNILVSPGPLYRVGEWVAPLEPATLGLLPDQLGAVNDDRLGRALDALASPRGRNVFFRLALRMLKDFAIQVERVHFDTTTVTFHGEYAGSKAEPRITRGVNKDHRPDLKQLMLGINCASDHAVPLLPRLKSGNQSDSTVHPGNVEEMRRLLGRSDFVYVGDSKVCSRTNLAYIAEAGGKFVTVLPRNRREDKAFREHLRREGVRWYVIDRVPPRRRESDGPDIFSSCRGPLDATAEGYRLIWIRSSHKAAQDHARREAALGKALAALQELSTRLNRRQLKTKGQIRKAVQKILRQEGLEPFLEVNITSRTEVETRYLRPGRPTPSSPVRTIRRKVHALQVKRRKDALAAEARTDGVFPLVTNLDRRHGKREVLRIYKYQAYVERRFSLLKTEVTVAPVYLKKPQRVAGLILVHFIAIVVEALLERSVRLGMSKHHIRSLPLLPEGRPTRTPTGPRILEAFRDVGWFEFEREGELVTFPVELSPLQLTLLDLLEVPRSAYL